MNVPPPDLRYYCQKKVSLSFKYCQPCKKGKKIGRLWLGFWL